MSLVNIYNFDVSKKSDNKWDNYSLSREELILKLDEKNEKIKELMSQLLNKDRNLHSLRQRISTTEETLGKARDTLLKENELLKEKSEMSKLHSRDNSTVDQSHFANRSRENSLQKVDVIKKKRIKRLHSYLAIIGSSNKSRFPSLRPMIHYIKDDFPEIVPSRTPRKASSQGFSFNRVTSLYNRGGSLPEAHNISRTQSAVTSVNSWAGSILNILKQKLSLNFILPALSRLAQNVIGCDRCNLYILFERTKELKCFSEANIECAILPYIQDINITDDLSKFTIVQRAASLRKTVFAESTSVKLGGTVKNYIRAIPLIDTSSNSIIGVLEVTKKIQNQKEPEPEINMFCTLLSSALLISRDHEIVVEAYRTLDVEYDFLYSIIKGKRSTSELPSIVEFYRKQCSAKYCNVYRIMSDHLILFDTNTAGSINDVCKIPLNKGIEGWVASSGEVTLTNDYRKHRKYNSAYEKVSDSDSNDTLLFSLICVPIRSRDDSIIGVLRLGYCQNKAGFSEHELIHATMLSSIIGFILEHQSMLSNHQRHSSLTSPSSKVSSMMERSFNFDSPVVISPENINRKTIRRFSGIVQSDMPIFVSPLSRLNDNSKELITTVMHTFRDMIGASRCCVFIVDPDLRGLVSLLTDFVPPDGMNKYIIPLDETDTSKHNLVLSAVLRKTIINVSDAYSDERFDPSIDLKTGYQTKSILCIPIFDSDNENVIGLIQLINKIGDSASDCFTKSDEKHGAALAKHVSVALQNTNLIGAVVAAQFRSQSLLTLMRDVSSEIHMRAVLLRIMDTCRELLFSDRCTIFILDKAKDQLWSTFADGGEEIRISCDTGIAGYVARSGQSTNIPNAYEDARFDRTVDIQTGYRTSSILSVPIIHFTGGLVGVMQMINKMTPQGETIYFNKEDESLAVALAAHIGIVLYNAQLVEHMTVSHRRSEALVDVMKVSSSHAPITDVIEHMILSTHHVLNATDVVLYLANSTKGEFYCRVNETHTEFIHNAYTTDDSIEAYVARKGRGCILNLKVGKECSSCSDANFIYAVPILCASVCDRSGNLLAVIKASGKAVVKAKAGLKKSRPSFIVREVSSSYLVAHNDEFTYEEENLLISMASEIAAVMERRSLEATFNSIADDFSKQNDEKSDPSFSLLSEYFAGPIGVEKMPSRMDFVEVKLSKEISSITISVLGSTDFDPWSYSENELLSLSVEIFASFKLLDTFSISLECIKSFLVTVHDGYKENPYHNFRHAFATLHSTYLLLTQGGALKHFEYLEILSMCVSAICHDINHDGLNNSYYINSGHELSLIYNDISVLENMHCNFTFRILKLPNHNILSGLTVEELKIVRKSIVTAILSTDMANHFSLCGKIKEILADSKGFTKQNKNHREILLDSIIHSSDLSNPVLPNAIATKWANAVFKEFNKQSAIEKKENLPLTPFMISTDLLAQAKLNLDFIDYIVGPLWNSLKDLLGNSDLMKHFLENLTNNREYWNKIIHPEL